MKLSLRWKLVGGFALLLALIVLLGSVTLSLFASLRNVQRRVFNEAIPQLVAVDEIVRSYTAQSAAVSNFLIVSNQRGFLDQYRQEVANAAVWEEEAEKLFPSGEGKRLLADLEAAGATFQSLVEDDVVPLALDGDRSQAFRVLGQEGTPLISQIAIFGSRLRQAQDRVVAQTESNLGSQANRTLVTLLAVTIGAVGLGLVLVVILPRRLSADLSALVDAARAIGAGDFDQRIEIRSGDEVEELAQRFDEMQGGLKRLQQLAMQDRELEIASTIQRNLLQRTLPHTPEVALVPLQRQANLVGGDWYDVQMSGRTLTVVIGDASGKGIGAALMAAVGLSVLRAEHRLGVGPKKVVERANEALREATDVDAFTTLLYANLDLDSGEVTWLNMGHPSPLILRRSEGEPGPRGYYLEGPRNRVLGWFDDPGFAETVINLQPGDRVVLFTDGFIEAKSTEGEVFGEHRFAETVMKLSPLGLDAIAEGVVADVERFAAGKLDDDLTMLIVEFHGAAAEGREAQTEENEWHSRR